MIIKRRYVPFCDLYFSDSKSKEILDTAFSSAKDNMDYNFKNRISVVSATMGNCISNFEYIMNRFDRLDKICPFDNGYSIKDVTNVKLVGKEDNSITVLLLHHLEGVEYPVSVVQLQEEAQGKFTLKTEGECCFNVF